MAHSITIIGRISSEVKSQLEQTIMLLCRGKNWIMNETLQKYLFETNKVILHSKIKQQSLLVRQKEMEEEKLWEKNQDTTGWI